LSEKGQKSPITQARLAEVLGIPAATIHAIEAGQRRLTERILQRIHLATGAYLNGGQWSIDRHGKDAFHLSFYDFWRRYHGRRPFDYESRIDAMHKRLDALFEKVPEKRWILLATRINDFLDGCKDNLKIRGIERQFRDTAFDSLAQLYASQLSSPELVSEQIYESARVFRLNPPARPSAKRKRLYG
jgi:transcriptional regulator with XRE-family HTH domain